MEGWVADADGDGVCVWGCGCGCGGGGAADAHGDIVADGVANEDTNSGGNTEGEWVGDADKVCRFSFVLTFNLARHNHWPIPAKFCSFHQNIIFTISSHNTSFILLISN